MYPSHLSHQTSFVAATLLIYTNAVKSCFFSCYCVVVWCDFYCFVWCNFCCFVFVFSVVVVVVFRPGYRVLVHDVCHFCRPLCRVRGFVV
jgi:hypothetical protein